MSQQQYSQEEGQYLVRELGQEDDINDLDPLHQQYNINAHKIKDDILFAIQGFGAIRKISKGGMDIEAYIKGKHCQQSIKDLCKLLKNDNPESPISKLTLAKYNIIQTDLLELLLTQTQDKKLSFWIIALLALLTNPGSQIMIPQQKQTLLRAARQYKKSFLRRQCLKTLLVHIADYFIIPKEQRKNTHDQMFEFIIILIRNLLQTPNSTEQQTHLHEYFIISMVKEELFETFLFLAQSQETDLLRRIDLYLLQIFYHTFTCFNPYRLYHDLKIKLAPEKIIYQKYKNVPTRNSRFNPNFAIVSKEGAITKIIHKIQPGQQNLMNIHTTNVHQSKKPFRRMQLKKVQNIQHKYIEQNLLSIHFQNHQQKTINVKSQVFQYCREFLQVSFSKIVDLVFNVIYREEERVTQKHKIYYLVLCSWAIEMTRNKYYREKQNAKTNLQRGMVQVDLNQIAPLMQFEHFELIFKILYRQVTKQKRKDFKVNYFHASITLFLEYLTIITDLSNSMSMSNRKNANALMANMFRHDVSRVLKLGFYLITHEGILQKMIIICYLFFKLLSDYSRGKVLTIQTNRLLRRKPKKNKKKQEQMEMQQFISHDESDDSNSQSYKGENGKELNQQEKKKRKQQRKKKKELAQKELQQQDNQQNDDNNPVFQQRKYNEMSQFSILAEYGIINKHLQLLRNQRFVQNKSQLNTAIFYYIQKISVLLKANWLFFQADTLSIIYEVLAHKEFMNKNPQFNKPLRQIAKSFIKLVKVNKLAIVESLFKYQSLSIKQNIISNYNNRTAQNVQEQYQKNLFND